jgi:hypothetical protein
LRTDRVVVSSSSGVNGTPGMIAHQGKDRHTLEAVGLTAGP